MLTLGILLGLLLVLIVVGMPISLALILSSSVVFLSSGIPLETVPIRLLNGVMKYDLLAVPLFIVMGNILAESGLAFRLIAFANSLVGFTRGGLAMVNVVTNMFMAEMSGASTADAAVLSRIFVPNMVKNGYDRGFAAAVTCASASLGIIIPPSIPMILLGLYTDMSVALLFVAGLIPGILMALFELGVCQIVARRRGYPVGDSFSIREVWKRFRECWFVLLIPILILASIFTGFATVTEAAELGLLVAIVGGLIYGRMGARGMVTMIRNGLRQSAVILLIVAASTLVSWVFADKRVAYSVADTLAAMHLPRWAVLISLDVFLIIIGTFLHGSATIIIVAPLFLPLMHQLGVDPIHYGMIIVMSQAIGQQTPPVATVLLTVASVSKVPMDEILPPLTWFLAAMVIVLLLVTFVPAFSTFLPGFFR